jgi:hypothetical protein
MREIERKREEGNDRAKLIVLILFLKALREWRDYDYTLFWSGKCELDCVTTIGSECILNNPSHNFSGCLFFGRNCQSNKSLLMEKLLNANLCFCLKFVIKMIIFWDFQINSNASWKKSLPLEIIKKEAFSADFLRESKSLSASLSSSSRYSGA